MIPHSKTRVLIIGDDVSVFLDYWKYYSQAAEYTVVGFVHAFWEKIEIKKFKGIYRNCIPIYELRSLERKIIDKNIQKCFLHVQNIKPNLINSIINRIVFVGTCNFEILPNNLFLIKACKPIITVTSVTSDIDKSIIVRYMLSLMKQYKKRVSIIIEYPKLLDPNIPFAFSNLLYDEYSPNSIINNDLYPQEMKENIRRYQICGADKIIIATDIQKALISAEQWSDCIICVANDVNELHVDAEVRFCAITEDYLKKISYVNWPGPKNFHNATHVIIIPHNSEPLSIETKKAYKDILSPKEVIFLWFSNQSDGNTLRQSKLMDHYCNIDNDAETVLVTIPCDLKCKQKRREKIKPLKEVDDKYNDMAIWINNYCTIKSPVLQTHFEMQVDVLEAFAKASCKELSVQNNDSANRETFCRMFLQGHLPPDFRVTTGEIIDSYMNTTGQLDVLIVNDSCPSMTPAGKTIIGPIIADMVLGVVEVKTTLTEDSLNKALNQLRSVRSLMPNHDTLINPDGSIVKDPLNGKIITGIFAFNEVPGIDEKAFSIIDEYPNVVDFVVLPGSFAYFSLETLAVCGIKVSQHESKNGYVRLGAKGMGIGMLYGLFNSIAAKRRFSGLNSLKYIQGIWGGKKDTLNSLTVETEKSLNKIDQVLVKGSSSEMRTKYFRAKSNFLAALEDFKKYNFN